MHAGAKGKGAYMNGQRIHVSQCKDVGMSLLVRHPSQQNLVAQQYVLVRSCRYICPAPAGLAAVSAAGHGRAEDSAPCAGDWIWV